MSRMDEYQITVTINGTDYGVWAKMDGGDADSTDTKYKPGGMQPEISLGGAKTVNNITVTRLYLRERDHVAVPALVEAVGKGAATITKQPLDVEGNVFGQPLVYTGVLKMVNLPKADAESAGAAEIALEISTKATIG